MLSKAVQNALNEQINHEMYSSYLYLGMSTFCAEANLQGFAGWLKVQSAEEYGHAMKLYGYIHDRGGHVDLMAIEKPAARYKSAKDVFAHVVDHEEKVTALIRKLYELAAKEKDYPTQILLEWFITEQVEEERNAAAIVERMNMIGDHMPAMIMLDRELGMRKSE
jgi:ferritin